jgi:hypothetical protein
MDVLTGATALGLAAVLLWAGLEKTRSRGSLRTALRQLGMPQGAGSITASLVAAMEVVVALGLVFVPGAPWTIAGMVFLSTAFALAGLIALRRDEPIHCGCFGPGGWGSLGKPQIAALPLWLGVAALLWMAKPTPPSLSQGFLLLATVALGMATIRGISASRAWKKARDDRESAQEMLLWLP